MVTLLLAGLLFGVCENCDKDETGTIKAAVFELSAVGVEQELVTTVSDLLRIELTECDRFAVISKGTMIDTLGEDLAVEGMNKVIAYCDSLGASFGVIGHMTQLGSKIIISVSLINKWTKKTAFSDKLTSASLEDLDMVIKRLADALCDMKKAKTSVTVETVTEAEAKPHRRRESYHTGGLMLGYIFPMGGSYGKVLEGGLYGDKIALAGDITAMPGANVSYLYETPYYMAEVGFGFHMRSLASLFSVEFGGYRFLSLKDVAPYVGGTIGMGWGSRAAIDTSYWITYEGDTSWHYYADGEGYDGLLVTLGGGIALFRTYDFHFLVGGKYHVVFGEGTPNGFVLSFGITYKKSGGGGCCIGI